MLCDMSIYLYYICLQISLATSDYQELLAKKDLCVDGSKIESTGFVYEQPKPTIELLKEVFLDYLYLHVVV